jgi:uncharacterized protein YigE (DUF2233 family)
MNEYREIGSVLRSTHGYRWRICLKLCFIVTALSAVAIAQDEPKPDSDPLTFRTVTFRGQTFEVVRAEIDSLDLQLHWKNVEGKRHGNFRSVRRLLADQGRTLRFATNAGIFTTEFAPGGLHVENGKELRALNTNEGRGNFHLMPNGVFYMTDDGAEVMETSAFAAAKPHVSLATQSGPMLVIEDVIHPAFNEGSENRRVRSGVGVASPKEVYFVLSEAPVNFYDFASLFKEELSCKNALYLDGVISAFHAPAFGKDFEGGNYAGILAIATAKPKAGEGGGGAASD